VGSDRLVDRTGLSHAEVEHAVDELKNKRMVLELEREEGLRGAAATIRYRVLFSETISDDLGCSAILDNWRHG
jgi:hypothetical protein